MFTTNVRASCSNTYRNDKILQKIKPEKNVYLNASLPLGRVTLTEKTSSIFIDIQTKKKMHLLKTFDFKIQIQINRDIKYRSEVR